MVVGCLGCDGEKRKEGKTSMAQENVGGKKRESDLKRGHVRTQNACDRSYIRAFDRICVE
jgi:hypothetical protein